jgi:hypothetical protein
LGEVEEEEVEEEEDNDDKGKRRRKRKLTKTNNNTSSGSGRPCRSDILQALTNRTMMWVKITSWVKLLKEKFHASRYDLESLKIWVLERPHASVLINAEFGGMITQLDELADTRRIDETIHTFLTNKTRHVMHGLLISVYNHWISALLVKREGRSGVKTRREPVDAVRVTRRSASTRPQKQEGTRVILYFTDPKNNPVLASIAQRREYLRLCEDERRRMHALRRTNITTRRASLLISCMLGVISHSDAAQQRHILDFFHTLKKVIPLHPPRRHHHPHPHPHHPHPHPHHHHHHVEKEEEETPQAIEQRLLQGVEKLSSDYYPFFLIQRDLIDVVRKTRYTRRFVPQSSVRYLQELLSQLRRFESCSTFYSLMTEFSRLILLKDVTLT